MTTYTPAGFFMLRTPALPFAEFLDLMEDPHQTDEKVLRLAQRPDVRRALLVASEDLTATLDRGLDELSPKRAAKVRSRLLRYLIRMATRPTPFGAFSGVAIGTFGPSSTLRLGSPALKRLRVRTDMSWLLSWLKEVEEDPELLRHLPVRLNPMAHRAGDRIVLPQADKYGQGDNRAVRIRATPAVDAVRAAAVGSLPYQRIVDELAAAFPQESIDTVEGLVRQLWDLGFLVGDLRPSQTAARPEQDVLKALADVPHATEAADRLRGVAELAERADDVASLRRLKAAQDALLPEHRGQPYQADASLDLRAPHLNASVGEAAADAVDVLMRLSTTLGGAHHLTRYREEFDETYGAGTRVPVLELLSADQGLDAPPTYTMPQRSIELPSAPQPDASRRDQALLGFAQEAWWQRAQEVELTDSWLDRIAPRSDSGVWPPVMDAYLQIAAANRGAVDAGEWRAVLRSDGLAHGGRTFGRFHDLIDEPSLRLLHDFAQQEERLSPEVAYAELAYLPSYGRAANVAVRPSVRPHEIPINTAPSVAEDRTIPLDDILVGTTNRRFYLWSQRLDREVVVAQHHMLSPALAPNVARFLIEVSLDGYVLPTGFYWGVLESSPFLPRVTRGRIVLRGAQWQITKQERDDLDGWFARWQVPRYVFLVDGDNRLLLDLDNPRCVEELRAELRTKPAAVLHEMLPGPDHTWLSDEDGRTYLEELVVPVIAKDAGRVTRDAVSRAPQVPVQRHLPGGEWTFLKLYAAPERHDEIITGPLRAVMAELRAHGLLDRWFYLRYADPFPHLRIRARSSAAAELLAALAGWGRDIVTQGLARDLAVSSYAPEVARYGGVETFDAVERLFTANSEVTAGIIAAKLGLEPEFLGVAVLDMLHDQWGMPLMERSTRISHVKEDQAARRQFRDNRDYLCELLSPWERFTHPEGARHRTRLAELLAPQAAAVTEVADAVRAATASGTLVGTADEVLGSLAHMQINRLLPVDLERETHCHRLWGQTLRAIRGRLAAGGQR
ncbi:lantibiotic dehydratase [Streptomyces sp. NPDC058657]|uniref:lantibiotic dehydratase n=1 Tax=unclassified Streptomyces TaxID=2593676 RepID=UPI0036565D4B